MLELLPGEYNNLPQVNSQANTDLNPALADTYSPLHYTRLAIPRSKALSGDWIYTQINRNDRDGDIYRQTYSRFWVSDTGEIFSQVYKLKKQSSGKAKVSPNAKFLARLRASQLIPAMPNGCNTRWHREIDQFVGVTSEDTCIIDSKYKDEQRRIYARDIVAEHAVWSLEGGLQMDGTPAFGLRPPNYIKSQRVP